MSRPYALEASQTPRIDIYAKGNTDRADIFLDMIAEYGIVLFPWQRLTFKRWVAEDEDGNLVNHKCGLSVPRQNGKTELIVARIIYGIMFRIETIYFTAQQQDTADVVKSRVQKFFYEAKDEEIFNMLTPRFRQKPRNYNFIEFENGAFVRFTTRSRMGGLGTTNDLLINDEAADMLDQHQATLLPTISASKNDSQVIYCGTPPMPTTVGEVFGRVRKDIMSGGKGSWTEWSVDHMTKKTDEEAWYKTNPSLGFVLHRSAIETEAGTLPDGDFNRMRLGWWSGLENKRAIEQKAWDECYTEKPEVDESYAPVYAVKFAPDRSAYSLAVAVRLKNSEKIHCEIVKHRPMDDGWAALSQWIIKRWRECAKIIIDGATGQPILFEELTRSGVAPKKIIMPTLKEIVAAHQFTYDGIVHQELSHYSQPLLDQTVRVTDKRPIGRYGGFGWSSMSKHMTTTALDAVTFAYWGQKVFTKQKADQKTIEERAQAWNDILSSL